MAVSRYEKVVGGSRHTLAIEQNETAENGIITHIIVAMRVQEIWTTQRRVS